MPVLFLLTETEMSKKLERQGFLKINYKYLTFEGSVKRLVKFWTFHLIFRNPNILMKYCMRYLKC